MVVITGGFLAASFAASAQPASRMALIGYLAVDPSPPQHALTAGSPGHNADPTGPQDAAVDMTTLDAALGPS